MSKFLGSGRDFLEKKIRKCSKSAGTPVVKLGFAGKEYSSKVIFCCWGKGSKISGGTIGLDSGLIKALRKKYRETDSSLGGEDLLSIIKSYKKENMKRSKYKKVKMPARTHSEKEKV